MWTTPFWCDFPLLYLQDVFVYRAVVFHLLHASESPWGGTLNDILLGTLPGFLMPRCQVLLGTCIPAAPLIHLLLCGPHSELLVWQAVWSEIITCLCPVELVTDAMLYDFYEILWRPLLCLHFIPCPCGLEGLIDFIVEYVYMCFCCSFFEKQPYVYPLREGHKFGMYFTR